MNTLHSAKSESGINVTPSDCNERVYQNAGNGPLLQLIADLAPGLALDGGCGAGDNARLLRQRGWRVTGLTISPSEQEIAKEFCESVWIGDLNSGIPREAGGPFDLIVFSHVLEHLLRPDVALGEARRLLQPSGVIAVALPNVLHWGPRAKFLFGKFEYESGGIMDDTHVRFYTFKSGMRLLQMNGFEIVSAQVDGWFPLPGLRRRLPGLARFLDPLVSKLFPGLFGWQSLYIARSKRP
jgi:SAM-dependent methyltransferase